MSDQSAIPENGEYNFSINYSERILACHVKKEGNLLHLHMDNNMNADLELQPDGTLNQVSGDELPDSTIDFVKKQVLGHEV